MMHLRYIGQLEAYIEEDHAGRRHTITAILPREEVEELYRRLSAWDWREIESAPKDGTHILLRYRWAHRSVYIAEGWWHANEWFCHGNPGVRATHWQPLPEPPKEPQP